MNLIVGNHWFKGSKRVGKAERNERNLKPSLVLELLIGCGELLKSFKCQAVYDDRNETRKLDQQFIRTYEKLCYMHKLTTPDTVELFAVQNSGTAVSCVDILPYVCTALLVFVMLRMC
ncbi:uncharacterized protein LOC131951889 [Physella acuta]|uniref:uncharacterized protein LOC131951889 n=1 Tax=Physella acuta TaxID=109671 RepID=UPI0027DD4AD8|nr:uncharacterized protein LOC131951889 [Physella acuta]